VLGSDHWSGRISPIPEFRTRGINHVALVCSDMDRTVDFYTNVLGMPLIKAIDLPDGMGQHFFFDAGNGRLRGVLLVHGGTPTAKPVAPCPRRCPAWARSYSAVGSMNHLAFNVPEEKFDEYRKRLRDKGVKLGRCSTTT